MRLKESPVTYVFLILCTVITLPGIFSTEYYAIFSGEVSDKNWSNYFLMVFQHGQIDTPLSILIHYGLNMVLLLLVGRWTEWLIGSTWFLALSVLAWGTFILTQWASGIWINGSSGIIWAYSPFLLYFSSHSLPEKYHTAIEMAKPLLWIMWVVVTLFMTFIPLLFNPNHTILHTLLYGNLFHLVATLTGLLTYFIWKSNTKNDGSIRGGEELHEGGSARTRNL